MGWLAAIGAVLQIILLFLKKWSEWDDQKKAQAKEILKEVPNAKNPASVTRVFDAINRL